MADSFYLKFGVEAFLFSGELSCDVAQKGGENMGRPRRKETTSPDELTLQVWEDMRAEVLHELEDGGDVPDSLMDIMGNLAATLDSWRAAVRSRTLQPSGV
jgi:hypothetical protein